MSATTIFTDIDYGRSGKQVGYLNLPHSPHTDAWGVMPIPIAVISHGSGPTVLMEGGNHGDEYEGPIVLGRLIRELDPATIEGRLIIIPAINTPAVLAGQRVSPVDGLNLNRCFPGNATGSMTQQIVYYVHEELFQLADAFVDLHSGGSSLDIIPSAILEPAPDAEHMRRNRDAVMAFGAPVAVGLNNLGDPRTSTASAVRAGLTTVGTELGSGGTVTREALQVAERGVHALLAHLGVMAPPAVPAAPVESTRLKRIPGADGYVYAPADGVFEAYHRRGDTVEAGQVAGVVHFLGEPGRTPEPCHYKASGLLFANRHPGHTVRGNCVAVVAVDHD